MAKILICDDAAFMRMTLVKIVEGAGHTVVGQAGNGRDCILKFKEWHPDIILMDEATSALDPISSSKIEDTLLKLKNDYSIIIVTHNMQQASRISDRTALLLNGDLIEYDRTEEMFLRPKEKITDDYLNGRFG